MVREPVRCEAHRKNKYVQTGSLVEWAFRTDVHSELESNNQLDSSHIGGETVVVVCCWY